MEVKLKIKQNYNIVEFLNKMPATFTVCTLRVGPNITESKKKDFSEKKIRVGPKKYNVSVYLSKSP